jgi:hypothetical protein
MPYLIYIYYLLIIFWRIHMEDQNDRLFVHLASALKGQVCLSIIELGCSLNSSI